MDEFSRLRGQRAESQASEFLQVKGFRLLEKNYHSRYGEIDLIMQDKDDIVFVEVRARSSVEFGNALESITRSKMQKLVITAKHFLQMKKWLYTVNSRFDVVVIHPVDNKLQLEWIKNAFWMES